MLEFIPLVAEPGGLPLYRPHMALETFVPIGGVGGAIRDDEEEHLRALIDLARSAGQQPVLTCSRLLARAIGCRNAFGGTHIVLIRDPFRQWASYTGLAVKHGSYYFINTVQSILTHGLHDPGLAAIHRLTERRRIAVDDIETFIAFLLLHAYIESSAAQVADVLVDVSAMAASKSLRQDITRAIATKTGLEVDLSDVRENLETSQLNPDDFVGLFERLDAAVVEVFSKYADPWRLEFARRRVRQAIDTARGYYAAPVPAPAEQLPAA